MRDLFNTPLSQQQASLEQLTFCNRLTCAEHGLSNTMFACEDANLTFEKASFHWMVLGLKGSSQLRELLARDCAVCTITWCMTHCLISPCS